MENDELSEKLRKLKEYPVGREASYVMGSGMDPVSLAHRISDLEKGMGITIRQVDLIMRTIHFVADEYNDKTMKELSEKLKGL